MRPTEGIAYPAIPKPKRPSSQQVVRRPHKAASGGGTYTITKPQAKVSSQQVRRRTAAPVTVNPAVRASMVAKATRIMTQDEKRAQAFAQAAKAKPKTGNTKPPAAAKPKHKSSGTSSHTTAPISKGHTGSSSHKAGSASSGSGSSPVTNASAVGGGIDWLRLIELGALAAGVILLLIYVRKRKRR